MIRLYQSNTTTGIISLRRPKEKKKDNNKTPKNFITFTGTNYTLEKPRMVSLVPRLPLPFLPSLPYPSFPPLFLAFLQTTLLEDGEGEGEEEEEDREGGRRARRKEGGY